MAGNTTGDASSSSSNLTSVWENAPPGFTEGQLLIERYDLYNAALVCIGYGILVAISGLTLSMLQRYSRTLIQKRSAIIIGVYTCLIFCLTTAFTGLSINYEAISFVDNRAFPGGPDAYQASIFNTPMGLTISVLAIVITFLSDLVVLYRLYVVWERKIWVTVLPAMTYLLSIGLGSGFLYGIHTQNLSGELTMKLNLGFWCTTVFYNVVLSLGIAGRIMLARFQLKRLGVTRVGMEYTSIAAMIVESAAIYVIYGLIYIVALILQTPLYGLLFSALSLVHANAQALINLRVVQGRAWDSTTFHAVQSGSLIFTDGDAHGKAISGVGVPGGLGLTGLGQSGGSASTAVQTPVAKDEDALDLDEIRFKRGPASTFEERV